VIGFLTRLRNPKRQRTDVLFNLVPHRVSRPTVKQKIPTAHGQGRVSPSLVLNMFARNCRRILGRDGFCGSYRVCIFFG